MMEVQKTLFGAEPKFFKPRLDFPLPERGFALHNRRYIGSKYKLADWIFSIISKECSGSSFADIFAGTGVIGAAAGRRFRKIILNDFLYSNHIIYRAFFEKGAWNQKKTESLISAYNNIRADELPENYFSRSFGGKYFSNDAAKIIGFARQDIERKKTSLSEKEYHILIASLLYSADKIANTVGHYDAYFKKPPAKSELRLRPIQPEPINFLSIFREDSNLLAKRIRPDVVYIDPPYNSRQYSRFYHVLETLVKWDSPRLYGKALKPERENMSDYCRESAKARFSELVKDITAKHLAVSYNNTYNSKSSSSQNKIALEEIKNILDEKGKTKVFEKDYRCFSAGNTDFKNHKEYLFVTSAARGKPIKRSPLFYVGDKYKLMGQLQALFPKRINNFYEPFTGGGTVFLNVRAKKYFLNDIDENLMNIHKLLLKSSANQNRFFKEAERIIKKHNLSYSCKKDIAPDHLKKKFKKTYYARFNKQGYEKLRHEANKNKKNDPLILYILLIYGFNRMLRFNGGGKFNLPVGNVDFNRNVEKALNDYFAFIKSANVQFTSMDFKEFFKNRSWAKDDFIYLDPPYLTANSEYNKLWGAKRESELLSLLNGLSRAGVQLCPFKCN